MNPLEKRALFLPGISWPVAESLCGNQKSGHFAVLATFSHRPLFKQAKPPLTLFERRIYPYYLTFVPFVWEWGFLIG